MSRCDTTCPLRSNTFEKLLGCVLPLRIISASGSRRFKIQEVPLWKLTFFLVSHFAGGAPQRLHQKHEDPNYCFKLMVAFSIRLQKHGLESEVPLCCFAAIPGESSTCEYIPSGVVSCRLLCSGSWN